MSNLENNKILEQAMEEYTETQEKLREILNKALDSTIDTIDQYRKIKTITTELKDFNDKILYLSGENPNNYPYRAKGPDPYYTPPTDSTGDIKI
jgi:hypothetical protein